MNIAVIALGSNIEPKNNIAAARALLARKYHVTAESTFITTKPVGFTDQPDFINGAVLLKTKSGLNTLTGELKAMERDLGRTKSPIKFGPRTIDLDVVVWNGKIISNEVLERDYLQQSVLELIPNIKMDRDTKKQRSRDARKGSLLLCFLFLCLV